MADTKCADCEKVLYAEDTKYKCPDCGMVFCFDCVDGEDWYCPECGADMEDQCKDEE